MLRHVRCQFFNIFGPGINPFQILIVDVLIDIFVFQKVQVFILMTFVKSRKYLLLSLICIVDTVLACIFCTLKCHGLMWSASLLKKMNCENLLKLCTCKPFTSKKSSAQQYLENRPTYKTNCLERFGKQIIDFYLVQNKKLEVHHWAFYLSIIINLKCFLRFNFRWIHF